MSWSEADRVQIRMFLGASSLWLQADPRLETAITAVQAIADGGQRVDNSTELAIRQIILALQTTDAELLSLGQGGGTTQAGNVKLDVVREDARLRAQGRRYVHRMARFLDTFPYSDVYGPPKTRSSGYPNAPKGGHNPYSE